MLAQDTPAGLKARAAGKRVRARSALSAAEVAGWPEVARVQADDGRMDVTSPDVEGLLRRWLAADAGLADLEVRPLNLEEAFLTRTAASTDEVTA